MVYIVGSGCGKKELITLKGKDALKKADCVIYDDLIDSSLLDIATRAEKIYMGKRSGCHSSLQTDITKKIIEKYREGKTVVRLKGGDPFVFGRGGEEILELQKNDIPFIFVPGISSCIAIPSLFGIPLTHRGVSRGFMVVTGHTKEGNIEESMLESMARFNGTIVILMGIKHIKEITSSLINKGKDKETPCSVVKGGNVEEVKVSGTLLNISEKVEESGITTPAIIVIGEVCALDLTDSSSFKTLKGVKVGVSGTADFRTKLSFLLEEKGAIVNEVQKLKVVENESFTLSSILKEDDREKKCIVLTSSNGVRTFFNKIKKEEIDIRRLSSFIFAVIGKGTEETLKEYGIKADIVPPIFDTVTLASVIKERVGKEVPIYLLRAEEADKEMGDILKKEGFSVSENTLYHIEKKEEEKKDLSSLSFICFSSKTSVRLFFSEYKEIPDNVKVIAIGKKTEGEIKKYYKGKITVSKEALASEIVSSIEKELDNRR